MNPIKGVKKNKKTAAVTLFDPCCVFHIRPVMTSMLLELRPVHTPHKQRNLLAFLSWQEQEHSSLWPGHFILDKKVMHNDGNSCLERGKKIGGRRVTMAEVR